MVLVSILPHAALGHAECGQNDHRENASHFSRKLPDLIKNKILNMNIRKNKFSKYVENNV